MRSLSFFTPFRLTTISISSIMACMMRIYSLPLLFILITSAFASTDKYPGRDLTDDAGSAKTEEKAIAKNCAGLTDSLTQLLDGLKLKTEARIFQFRDSLLSKSLRAADSILPTQELKSMKENLQIISDQKSCLKFFIVNSADALRSIEETILAGYEQIPHDSAEENDVYGPITDSLGSVYEVMTGTIADSVSSLLDAFGAYVDEVRQRELEKPADITISISSSTHSHTNMRDDGLNQFVTSPSIMFNLLWGFSAGRGIGYYPTSSKTWDGSSLDVNYDLSVSKQISLSAGYSYFQFSSSSKLRKASFNNSVAVAISYLDEKIYFGTGIDLYIGKVNDPVFHIAGGYPFVLTRDGVAFAVSSTPEFLVCWGSQDQGVTNAQLKKLSKTNAAATETKSKKPRFGILGYEISLPVECTVEKLSFKFAPDFIIPVNVEDGSNTSPWVDLSLDIEFALNLFE